MKTPSYDDAVRFHGHSCPGLALGYRMTVAGLEALAAGKAEDEEIVAIVENDACGVDAVQVVAGCTFGKGNLVFRDYGKPVYTFFSRALGRGVRVLGHRRGVPAGYEDDRAARIGWILSAPEVEILSLHAVEIDEPPPARVVRSRACGACGEPVMETRLREVGGCRLCSPCAEARRR